MSLCGLPYSAILRLMHGTALLLAFLAHAQAQQSGCPLLEAADLGPTDAPSREGLVASSYLSGDAAEAPLVQILEHNIVCLAPAAPGPEASEDTYLWSSAIVRYTCEGAILPGVQQRVPCGSDGPLEVTAQFEFGCSSSFSLSVGTSDSEWSAGVTLAGVDPLSYVVSPPDGDFETDLMVDCLVCVNPDEGGVLGLEVDLETHCADLAAPVVTCVELSPPDNGAVSLSDPTRVVGTIATYSCNEGYELSEPETRECGNDGQWTGDDPICEIVDCETLTAPDNGTVDLSNGTTFDSIAVYSCDDGLTLVGSETRVCQADGEWSDDDPSCVPSELQQCFCWIQPCTRPTAQACPKHPDAACVPDTCGGCLSRYYIGVTEVTSDCAIEPVSSEGCFCAPPQPCTLPTSTVCPNFPTAECVPDPCAGCLSRYYHGGQEVTSACSSNVQETNYVLGANNPQASQGTDGGYGGRYGVYQQSQYNNHNDRYSYNGYNGYTVDGKPHTRLPNQQYQYAPVRGDTRPHPNSRIPYEYGGEQSVASSNGRGKPDGGYSQLSAQDQALLDTLARELSSRNEQPRN